MPAARKLGIRTTMVFMQDGAPPHFRKTVRQWLNQKFPERWMGREGSIAIPTPFTWPPYSPDLTPCDFFLWGHIKAIVYADGVPANLEELKQRIQQAFEEMPQEMVDNAVEAFPRRLQKCIDKEGKNVE